MSQPVRPKAPSNQQPATLISNLGTENRTFVSSVRFNVDRDQPRDHPGKCLYYYALRLYIQSHCRLRNRSLVCVL